MINTKKMNAQDAIQHISNLFPPDSPYKEVRKMGQDLMDYTIGNKVGYYNWRELPESDLIALAKANLIAAGEDILA